MFNIKTISKATVDNPDYYVIDNQGLIEAVNLAASLQKPLLISGSPGTGKTQLAFKIARELSKIQGDKFAPFRPAPYRFNTKTTSNATDLFYYYDAIRHFQSKAIHGIKKIYEQDASIIASNPDMAASAHATLESNNALINIDSAHRYISLNAFGKAILQTYGSDYISKDEKLKELTELDKFAADISPAPASSVVLIDEVDKASKDFPNDLLSEIETYEFKIRELNIDIIRSKIQTPVPVIVIIITSNSEKALPDAFLRRCLFYNINPPGPEELQKIVNSRMTPFLSEIGHNENALKRKLEAISKTVLKFSTWQSKFKDKKPATSELLEWIRMLEMQHFFDTPVDFDKLTDVQRRTLEFSLPILAKTRNDFDTVKIVFN
jgi:MoxR-like ATPase